jgi:hypothetical protein
MDTSIEAVNVELVSPPDGTPDAPTDTRPAVGVNCGNPDELLSLDLLDSAGATVAHHETACGQFLHFAWLAGTPPLDADADYTFRVTGASLGLVVESGFHTGSSTTPAATGTPTLAVEGSTWDASSTILTVSFTATPADVPGAYPAPRA